MAPEPLISAMYAAEFVETGSFEMSVFHALSDGSTAQPPTVGPARRRRRVVPAGRGERGEGDADRDLAAKRAYSACSCVRAPPVYRSAAQNLEPPPTVE